MAHAVMSEQIEWFQALYAPVVLPRGNHNPSLTLHVSPLVLCVFADVYAKLRSCAGTIAFMTPNDGFNDVRGMIVSRCAIDQHVLRRCA